MVHNNVNNTRMAARLYLATFINDFCSQSVTSYLDACKTSFNHPTVQEYHLLTLRGNNCKHLQPSYPKSSSWLTKFD